MTSFMIDHIDDDIAERLRMRAARHGRSVEDEAGAILQDALMASSEPTGRDLAEALRARIAEFGYVELDLPPRNRDREPPRFD